MVSRFAPATDPMRFEPKPSLIEEYEMFQIQCPWCGNQTWCYPYSSDIKLHSEYEFYGGPGEGSDCSCWKCGRGIYKWWTNWVIYAEYEGPKGGSLLMRDYSDWNYTSSGLASGPGQLSTTEGKEPNTLNQAVRLWKRDPETGETNYYERNEKGWGMPL